MRLSDGRSELWVPAAQTEAVLATLTAHLREAQVRQPVFGANPDWMRIARVQARVKIDIASPSVARWRSNSRSSAYQC